MKRRSFLGMLGLGGAAVSMAPVNTTADVRYAIPNVIMSHDNSYAEQAAPEVDWRSMAHNAQLEFDAIVKNKEEIIEQHYLQIMNDEYHRIHLPPDIAALKSFSGAAKQRLYYRRMAERRYEEYHRTLWGRVQEYLGRQDGTPNFSR